MNRREKLAASQRRRRAQLNAEDAEREREATRERMRARRAQLSQLEIQRRREADAAAKRDSRERQTRRQVAVDRQINALAHEQRRENETQDSTQRRQNIDAMAHRTQRAQESPGATECRRRNDADEHRESRRLESPTSHRQRVNAVIETTRRRNQIQIQAAQNEAINFSVDNVEQHSCGQYNVKCAFCGSINFRGERPSDGKFTYCCRKGKFKLPTLTDQAGNELKYPDELKQLITSNRHFREHIRSYNNALSFASMGAKVVDVPGRGPYVFKIQGHAYHVTSHIQPLGNEQPQYGQLYFIDTSQATETRLQHPANSALNSNILRQLDQLIRRINSLAQEYKTMREVVEQYPPNAQQMSDVNIVFRRDRNLDKRRYNLPANNEIAMVFENSEGEPPFHRDIRLYYKNPNPERKFVNFNILSPNLDPCVYTILLPFGQAGWEPNIQATPYDNDNARPNRSRKSVSMLQYYSATLAFRGEFNPFLESGKLSQQYIVDAYSKIEANNLNWVREHQRELRAANYQELQQHVNDDQNHDDNVEVGPAGIKMILPSSFEGSPRNMRERCRDAMSIFSKFGAPDLFVTFTANPNWPEIQENLREGQTASDRPDLVARVFNLKLEELINDITKKHIFGTCVAYVYTIETQKRGLLHAHILIKLLLPFTTRERVDQVVFAEIPEDERLREIVLSRMVHGPCGFANPNAPCMVDGKCSKDFPKPFRAETILDTNGYPLYRRRQQEPVAVGQGGRSTDNSYIVPYNPFLLWKYNAHINVEICTSIRAVIYIYKYIYKGYDCAEMQLTNRNEIHSYINCRYISATEAMWRIHEYKMHNRSHTVTRLPVHLPDQQYIVFNPDNAEEVLNEAQGRQTKLEAYFALNAESTDARERYYTEIPTYYVFKNSKWNLRQRGGEKIVSRMYSVSIRDEERFYLRTLLLHVRGATSYENLRTFNGTINLTFKAAAVARGLLASDDEWDRCMTEAATFQMPRQLRETFAFICIFGEPSNALELWNNHVDALILDYLRNDTNDVAVNKALHDVNEVLKQHGQSCANYGLPIPTGNPFQVEQFDRTVERREGERRLAMLNDQQRAAFNQIMAAIDNENQRRFFYLDGPGGSGKTFLYCTLMSVLRGNGSIVLPFATTGIAATLLPGGRTCHSGFKLPVPLLDTSVSGMRPRSAEAQILKEADLIIIDEITMLPKHGLRCIDLLLQEITGVKRPFGNKTLVIGGDFRQTLPVVPKGSKTEIIECCIKSSSLWRSFRKITLSSNMRSAGQSSHNEWLLKVGTGNTDTIPALEGSNLIKIPTNMTTDLDLTDVIFGGDLTDVNEISKRVIVAPTNARTLEMNNKIIERLPGSTVTYSSADSIELEDPNDAMNYPVEFLNSQTPSGVPPHKLNLKEGTVVMLLRNLNPKKGLCNGTRLMITRLGRNCISARIISEFNNGEKVLIPRIDIKPSDTTLPFVLKRRQFPIIPAYAMTINKSQGQTFDHVEIDLPTPVFTHGQLYVALSRSRNPANIKVRVEENPAQGKLLSNDETFTANIVYKEVFDM